MSLHHAGEAIARERKLAGLSQQQLADRLRYSTSMLRAVEQGRRPASPALVAAAARTLGVEPELLTGQPYRDVLGADGPLEGLSELRAILSEGDYVRGTEPGTYEELSAELAAVNDADRAGHSRRALTALPALIRKLYGALEIDPEPRIYSLLAGAYNASDRLCRRFGHMALTVPSIDRFDWAAARSGDPLNVALGKILRTRLLMYHDSTHIALRLVDEVTDTVEGPSEGELSVRGAAHLAGAVAAARARRPDTARDHITAARQVAKRLGHETRSYETLFGPANTDIHAIGVELEAGDPGIAAHEGSALALPGTIARSRAGHHWQDVSRAWLMIGKPDQALAALNKARRVAPQQTRLHPSVRETIYGIAAAQRRRTDSLQGFAAWLGVGV
ncbi:transcriptional regulator with XRE-family HTH domain [Nocardia transvalensis]|uniref:Transcriptional regulator with XRE-family HTH domain n=1 Tax=Nocardia transvalensis TaxID=37333 RepID=A0A7W9UJL8_9NOCA|nr:helix-turn-helix transcriptional regulator [Nocardia transvalensis]MBB5915481.1 transcriptional regulator with XRE-family HTH domain [Nocardia transvalensis]